MSTLRFTPNSFLYNGRVAIALVPSLIVAAALGGKLVMGVLTVGCMVAYILDALQYREGSFTAVWSTLALADVGLVVNVILNSVGRPWILTAATILTLGALFVLAGMWATLQFQWIQMRYPAVAVVFERQVITASIPVAAVVQTVGMASLVEVADVPYYMAGVLLVLYSALARPLVSSFHAGGRPSAAIGGKASSSVIIQTAGDAFLLYLITVMLPAVLYIALHLPVLHHWVHISGLMLTSAAPVVLLCSIRNGMWWLPGSPNLADGLRKTLLVAAAVVALVGFEGRVVFHSFGQYIQLQAPYNYIAVTLALAGFGSVFVAHVTGYLESHFDVTLAGTAMLLCTTAGGLAAGIPFQWLPAPLIAACGLALYYDTRSLREYVIFVVGALLTVLWFVKQHYWFLDVHVGSFHLHTLCKLVLSALVPALLVPGLVTSHAPPSATGALLVFQALCISVLEEQLYVPSHQELVGEAMYPPYLVLATSALGLAAAHKLMTLGLVPRTSYWLLLCTYCAKLFMLALPEAYLVTPITLLLLAATAPMFVHKADPGRRSRLRLAPWQVLLHVLACLLAVALARFALFDLVQWLLMARPPEGLLLGCLVLTAAGSLVPLVVYGTPGSNGGQKALALLALGGILLILLRPPLPITGGARCPKLPLALCPRLWDQRHIPMHDTDDVAIWGAGIARREHWPKWLLMAACTLGATSVAGPNTISKSVLARLGLGTASGLLVGMYLALEVVPGQELLQALLVAASMLVVAFIALVLAPLAKAPAILPFLGVLWAGTFAATMLLQSALTPPDLGATMRLFPDNILLAEAEREASVRSSLLGVFAAHSLLLAFTLKLKMSAALRSSDGRGQQGRFSLNGMPDYKQLYQSMDFFCGVVPSNVFSSFGKMLQLEGAAQVALQRLATQQLAWAPTAGNALTLLAFSICVALNATLTGGQPEAIFMLAPLLLLLSQDALLLRGLGEQQRYAPPITAASLYLAASTLVRIYLDGTGLSAVHLGVSALRLVALVAAMPLHLLFLRFLWQQRPCPGVALLLLAPLCGVVPLVYSPYKETVYLALSGPVMALLQHMTTRHKRQVGMKVI